MDDKADWHCKPCVSYLFYTPCFYIFSISLSSLFKAGSSILQSSSDML